MTAGIAAAWSASWRHRWRAMVVVLAALTLALSITGLALRTQSAQAAALAPLCDANTGASTATLTCTVDIVNSVTATGDHSVTTVTVHCTIVACADEQNATVTPEPFLINSVNLCNGSNEEGGQTITCALTITDNIDSDTPAATAAVTAPAIRQCQGTPGSGQGTALTCSPQVAQASPLIRACNNSVTGGGGSVTCTVASSSTTSAAIPLSVDLCNNTGIGGGTFLTCSTVVTTNIVDVGPAPSPSVSVSIGPSPSSTAGPTVTGTAGPTGTAAPTGTAGPTSTATGTATATPTVRASGGTHSASPTPTTRASGGTHPPQVSPMPSGGAGTGS